MITNQKECIKNNNNNIERTFGPTVIFLLSTVNRLSQVFLWISLKRVVPRVVSIVRDSHWNAHERARSTRRDDDSTTQSKICQKCTRRVFQHIADVCINQLKITQSQSSSRHTNTNTTRQLSTCVVNISKLASI